MSIIKNKFYHLFWNNPSCQNLFLLSKEELLETKTFGEDKSPFTFSTNRIIVSNAQDNQNEFFDTIKTRSEIYNVEIDSLLNEKIEYFKPLIEQFFDSKFKKSIERLMLDIEKKPLKFLSFILKVAADEENREVKTIEFLQKYGFIGKNLNSFKEIETSIGNSLIPSKNNELINENTINTFFEGVKFVKELYVNHSYKNLYNTNQILINTLNSEDNFQSRIKLFGELYDSKIIAPSKDDAFIECSHCDPLTYRGVFQLRLNPKKLKDLKCPVCSNELTYFVPYKLHEDIYKIVKKHDGLILDALQNKLYLNGIKYEINKKFLNDIEVDCIFRDGNRIFIVETKMYKQNNTTEKKLISKIKEHFSKLIKDVERIEKNEEFLGLEIVPFLITNINNQNILRASQQYFNSIITENKYYDNGNIINLNLLKIKS
ncbi:hypothetical protein [Flavobacterium sp. J27]|uniref:hypothetical protein n=1 Tax=Flavobacterium sp. J27 TaxID=2060419 RepID=UPI00103274A4|nr:hypothetical protein [Flavobacterium sp. J27]